MLTTILMLPRRPLNSSFRSAAGMTLSSIHQTVRLSREGSSVVDTGIDSPLTTDAKSSAGMRERVFALEKEKERAASKRSTSELDRHRPPPALTIRSGSQNLLKELKLVAEAIPPAVLRDLRSKKSLTGMKEKQKSTLQTLLTAATSGTAKPKKFIYNNIMAHLINSHKRGKIDSDVVRDFSIFIFYIANT